MAVQSGEKKKKEKRDNYRQMSQAIWLVDGSKDGIVIQKAAAQGAIRLAEYGIRAIESLLWFQGSER